MHNIMGKLEFNQRIVIAHMHLYTKDLKKYKYKFLAWITVFCFLLENICVLHDAVLMAEYY